MSSLVSPAAAPPEGPQLDEVLSKLRHYLGLLDQITPAEAQDRRTGDLHLTVAELRVLVEAFAAGPGAAPPAPSAAAIAAAEAHVLSLQSKSGLSDLLHAAYAVDFPPVAVAPAELTAEKYVALCQHVVAMKSRLTMEQCSVFGAALTEYADLLREKLNAAARRAPPAALIEPTEAMIEAAFHVLWGEKPKYESLGDVEGRALCARDEERWEDVRDALRAALAAQESDK